MILLRCKKDGRNLPAVLDKEGCLRDLSGHIKDINASSLDGFSRIGRFRDIGALPRVDSEYTVLACITGVGQILSVRGNYVGSSYFVEGEPPRLLLKASSSIGEPNGDIVLPEKFRSTVAEVSLGVVIGKRAKFVKNSDAVNYIAGYCVVGDLGDYQQGKEISYYSRWSSLDSFTPLGTRLATVSEVGLAENLDIWLCVNGECLQESSTSNMLMSVSCLMEYATEYMTLNPGDLLLTGTPPSLVSDPVFLKQGDRVTLGIEGLGEQAHEVVSLAE